jgi:ABC-2 type transport system permease protein
MLNDGKADALVIIPDDFTTSIEKLLTDPGDQAVEFEFVGDLSNIFYLVSAVWANEIIDQFVYDITGYHKPVTIRESSLGISGTATEFDLVVPGLLVLSLIMLMFSASIAFVAEVENRTMIRLKLSQIKPVQFLSGVGIFQLGVGIISILITLATALLFGFNYSGSLAVVIFIAVLTSLSIIAFSLILAAFTKTVNEILIVGNFPLFLFMFFTGAAFPIEGKPLFHLAGYPVSVQGLMSPTHSIQAMKKVMILHMDFRDIIPEMLAVVILSVIYFIVGVWFFRKKHMR